MTPRVVVVGLGPAGPELVTQEALAAIARVPVRFVRTARHPSAHVAGTDRSFDHVYDSADTFAEVYEAIASDLVAAAEAHGEVLYAVPGSPLVLERTVALLRDDDRVEVDIVAGLSFLDLAWERLGVDPVEARARLVDGHAFASAAAGESGPLLVAHAHARWVLSDIKLAVDEPPTDPVTVLQRLGSPDEAVFDVAWADLDRSFEPDHLTALWVPVLSEAPGAAVVRLEALMDDLRVRCPWDREQTHGTLRRHLLEEAHEALESLDGLDAALASGDDGALDDAYAHVSEELGDLLFQVVFHARLGAEAGRFELADVARGVHDKLVDRHPYLFGPEAGRPDAPGDAAALGRSWELTKLAEKGRASVMDGIPVTLPALAYASKVAGKAATVAPDLLPAYDDAPVTEDAVAEALLALVLRARAVGVDAESALRSRARRLADDVRAAEAAGPHET